MVYVKPTKYVVSHVSLFDGIVHIVFLDAHSPAEAVRNVLISDLGWTLSLTEDLNVLRNEVSDLFFGVEEVP